LDQKVGDAAPAANPVRGGYLSSDEPGDRREEIFPDHLDRKSFLATLGATSQKSGWQVHAYCLMSNHFHLVAW
jgi:hypothetical protein